MAVQGPLSAGTGASSGTPAWASPTRIVASDDSRTTNNTLASLATTATLISSAHGFTIPAGATIDGILVEIERSGTSGALDGIEDSSVRLATGGVAVGTNKATTATWPVVTAEAYASYGGAADTWGRVWTDAEINATNFGVHLVAVNTDASTRDARVDHIRITVTYTAAGGVVHDGAASVTLAATVAPAAGLIAAGDAAVTLAATTAPAGGLILSAGTGVALTATVAPAGALVAGGAAMAALVITTAADGSIVGATTIHDGAAAVTLAASTSAAGGLVAGGGAVVNLSGAVAGAGSTVIGGQAAPPITLTVAAAGATLLAGGASVVLVIQVSATGAIIAGTMIADPFVREPTQVALAPSATTVDVLLSATTLTLAASEVTVEVH